MGFRYKRGTFLFFFAVATQTVVNKIALNQYYELLIARQPIGLHIIEG
tara:strand:- start:238 stop:381 length:144 start_codon:yes stop_codon:yes gene_type:complete